MKKSELKPVKKNIKEDIKTGLIKELKTLTAKFGEASEKLEKSIAKGSKKLAKKVVKDIKIATAPVEAPAPKAKSAKPAEKATEAPAAKVVKKAVKKAPVKKEEKSQA